jgi:hypothetical protein
MPLAYPDLTRLYRFPFTATDNPNTVIEPTTRCNLSCPGCYRRSLLAYNKEREMSLEDMKQYIDDVLRMRNTSCFSFLGGEPLLHPQLHEAMAYAKQRGVNVGVYTNGLLLDEKRLAAFRDLGVSYCLVHVSKHQGRGATEDEINRIREHFCEMFRKVGGVQFGVSFQLMETDLPDLPKMVDCFRRNADVLRLVGFVTCTDGTPEDRARPTAQRSDAERALCKAVAEAYGLEWSSYLGSRYDETLPGKICALCAFHKGKLLGSVDATVIREKTERAHRKTGKYPYTENIPGDPELADLKYVFFNRSIRNIYLNLLRRFGLRIDWQYVAVSFNPMLTEQGVNYCDGCTDSVLWEGKFVPMCGLEYFIKGESPPGC